MPSFRTGTVVEVVSSSAGGVQELTVRIGDDVRRALLYPRWAASAKPGDRVILNTTAVDLDLGTGGTDFVVWNQAVETYDAPSDGHIMKLRYTPAQCDVLAVESPESPHHDTMAEARSLNGVPVVATSLHSQLVPVMCGLRASASNLRVVYVMTDGAALEAGFSDTLRVLRERNWLKAVVTAGHAVGGDLESVTLHSGLLAAVHVLEADVVIAGVGPGVVGTATPYGTTALDLGTIALAAQYLGGSPIVCLRLSDADPRPRHRGLSHHVVAALGWVSSGIDRDVTCAVAPSGWATKATAALPGWRIEEEDPGDVPALLAAAADEGISVTHMGRTISDDRLFFDAAAAAGAHTSRRVTGS